MGYTTSAIKGFTWVSALRIFSRALSLLKTMIVARFLSPSQFGLFGIASLTLAFVEVVTETGVNVFLVQEKGNINKYLGTALIVSVARGAIITIAMIIATPFIANFFNAPEAKSLLYAMSAVPFIRGFINPAVAIYQKDLLFDKEFLFRSINITVEIVATLTLLYIYPEPITLIFGIIIGVLSEIILSYVLIPTRPKLLWKPDYIKKLFHHGKWITGLAVFNFGFDRGDNIFVGRMLGTSALGIYDMVYRISMLPVTEVVTSISKVTFPVYVQIRHDHTRLKRAYLRTICTVALITIPFGLILALFPEEIVRVILGDMWLEAVPVLQVLAILAVVRGISIAFAEILFALKKQKYVTLTTGIGLLGLLVTIAPFINEFGLLGAAYSASFGYMLSVPFTLFFSLRELSRVKSK